MQEPVDPQLKDWHRLTPEEYQERLYVEEPILVQSVSNLMGFVEIADTGEWVEVTRFKDGSKVQVLVYRSNYLGFSGYTARGELIIAYADNMEAPPYSEEERQRDAERAWEQKTEEMNK